MQDENSICSANHPDNTNRKAAFEDAFRWSPVALAILISSLCIIFLFQFQPASATSNERQNHPGIPSREKRAPTHEDRTDTLSHVFSEEVLYWEKDILKWANTYQLDPDLVAVVMQIESCGHPNIESRSGAKGLFQVMPFHFTEGENPFKPDTNADRGLSYLSRSLSLASNDPTLALAGYNGGHGVISLEPLYWPEETKRYVYWASGILAEIHAGETQSSRLNEWMLAGGESLCTLSSIELGL
jgi:hypothetical protein